MTLKLRKILSFFLMLSLSGLFQTGAAVADDVANKLDSTIDADLETMSLKVGSVNGMVNYSVVQRDGDGVPGCNLTDQAYLTLSVSSSDSTVAAVVTPYVVFTSCGAAQTVKIKPVGAGSASITLSVVENTTGGTFDLAPAAFTANVAPSGSLSTDTTAPIITPNVTPTPNNSGWSNSDATLSWVVTDPESSIVSKSGCDTTTISNETSEAVFTCSATSAGGTKSQTAVVRLDKTLPVISLEGGPEDGATYNYGSVPAAPTCVASDALSGLNGDCTVTGYDTSLGQHTLTATVTDNAGNSAVVSKSYAVIGLTLNGFYQPVDMNGVYNVVKNGSTVPLKFEIFSGATEMTDVSYVKDLKYAETKCDASAVTDYMDTTATGDTVLRYDATAGQFIYNWKTPKTAGKCYVVVLTAIDGSSLTAYFKLK